MTENIIKSKIRVQKHGEVFTPKRIVAKMLDLPEVKAACENITATFLEPAAGEGAFLGSILERKLQLVIEKYNQNIVQFENYSLLALSTLYGVELLEDNAQTCAMNMFQLYFDKYREQVSYHGVHVKENVLESAKEIIAANIEQGDFLTRKDHYGNPIVFTEWKPIEMNENDSQITIQRTEYTLDEIYENVKKESGTRINNYIAQFEQMNIFHILGDDDQELEEKTMRFTSVPITEVDKVVMEEL